MSYLSCGVTWRDAESFLEAEKYGVLLEKYGVLSSTFDVVRSRRTGEDVGVIEMDHVGIYRPDGVALSRENVKFVQSDTLFIPSKLAGGLLCADCFGGAVVGYTPTYLDAVTVECDEAAVEIVHFLLEKPNFVHEFKHGESHITLKVVHEHYFDSFITLRIIIDGDFTEVSMLPEGGNLYTIDDAIVIKKVRAII